MENQAPQSLALALAQRQSAGTQAASFTSLALETRTHVSTEHAAHLLNRRPQTLRIWACYENRGPLRPVRVNGRLAWPVTEIKRVLGVA